MLSDKDLRELILGTKPHINLLESVIEKDYYVTQVIHALSCIENEHFRLVFAGGTCLAKAHKIVKRMSEDVDYKIQQFKNQHPEFAEDPVSEINNSLEILKKRSHWQDRYQTFLETMVYDDRQAVSYAKALDELNLLRKKVINSLNFVVV